MVPLIYVCSIMWGGGGTLFGPPTVHLNDKVSIPQVLAKKVLYY